MRCATIASLFAVLVTAVTGTTVDGNSQLEYCSGRTIKDIFKDLSVDINPMPPQKGKDLTFSIAGNPTRKIDGGTVKMHVDGRKLIFPVKIDENDQICDLAKNAGNPCPIEKGTRAKIVKLMQVPKSAPDSINIKVEGFDSRGDRAFCVIGNDFHIDQFAAGSC